MATKEQVEKNTQKVQEELQDWAGEMKDIGGRLSKPSMKSSDREHFVPHVLAGILPETLRRLPRTISYTAYFVGAIYLGSYVWEKIQ